MLKSIDQVLPNMAPKVRDELRRLATPSQSDREFAAGVAAQDAEFYYALWLLLDNAIALKDHQVATLKNRQAMIERRLNEEKLSGNFF